MQTTPAVAGLFAISEAKNESVESSLTGLVSSRIESEMVGTLLRERVKAEPTEVTTESHFDDMFEALKRGFLSSLIVQRSFYKKGGQFL